jgi:hypothetical protein
MKRLITTCLIFALVTTVIGCSNGNETISANDILEEGTNISDDFPFNPFQDPIEDTAAIPTDSEVEKSTTKILSKYASDPERIKRPSIEITTTDLPHGAIGEEYLVTIKTNYDDYTTALTRLSIEGSLPKGLRLVDNKIEGIPEEKFQGEVKIKVSDKRNWRNRSERSFTLTIEAAAPRLTLLGSSGKTVKCRSKGIFSLACTISVGKVYRLRAGDDIDYKWRAIQHGDENNYELCDNPFSESGSCHGASNLSEITGPDLYMRVRGSGSITLTAKNSTANDIAHLEWETEQAPPISPITHYRIEVQTGTRLYAGSSGTFLFIIDGLRLRIKGGFHRNEKRSFNQITKLRPLEFKRLHIRTESKDGWLMAGIKITTIRHNGEEDVVYFNPCIQQFIGKGEGITLRTTDIGVCVVTETQPKGYSKNSGTVDLVTIEFPEIDDLPRELEDEIANLPRASLPFANIDDQLLLALGWNIDIPSKLKSFLAEHTRGKRGTYGTYLPGAMEPDGNTRGGATNSILSKLRNGTYTLSTDGHDAWWPSYIKMVVFTPSPPSGKEKRVCSGIHEDLDGITLSTGDKNHAGVETSVSFALRKNGGPCDDYFTTDDPNLEELFYNYNGKYNKFEG